MKLDKTQAEKHFDQWLAQVKALGLVSFDPFVITLSNWRDIFLRRQTSGFVEGLNNKIKVIKRRCYGIVAVMGFIIWGDCSSTSGWVSKCLVRCLRNTNVVATTGKT